MLSQLIPSKRTALLVLLLPLLLTGCGTGPIRFIPPPPERMAAVAPPTIPPATTPCAFDPTQLCNTDEETANVINAYDAALALANQKLEWLRTFFANAPK